MSLKKTTTFAGGFVVFKAINFVFYTLLSPAIIALLDNNIVSKILVMVVIGIRSILVIWGYDKLKKDIFLREEREEKKVKRLQTHQVVKKHPIKKTKEYSVKALFFLFWIFWDPAIFVLYHRQGFYLFNGIPTRKLKFLFGISIGLNTIVILFVLSLIIPILIDILGIIKILIYIIFY